MSTRLPILKEHWRSPEDRDNSPELDALSKQESPEGARQAALGDEGVSRRGFMGFDVLRSVVDDLRSRRIRFGTLALRWRGEPLLHPEIEGILRYLLDTGQLRVTPQGELEPLPGMGVDQTASLSFEQDAA